MPRWEDDSWEVEADEYLAGRRGEIAVGCLSSRRPTQVYLDPHQLKISQDASRQGWILHRDYQWEGAIAANHVDAPPEPDSDELQGRIEWAETSHLYVVGYDLKDRLAVARDLRCMQKARRDFESYKSPD
ncbi:hypothetical protein COV18_05955 [Candidatus Woesearchaeota archaeon CG10_big_fil_rev_8_21_14_0_10_37_12]|nr:MAG: hypothetical protein COV18_05955 [Candidatus Woesearchaeota archaeon CG10_big_fil_rev_8_21_14_0_10_37_12]